MATLETFPSGTKSISVEVSTPTTPGKHPAVLVVYGTEGLRNDQGFGTLIRNFAASLADEGFVALIPDYFQSTGTAPGVDTVWPALDSSQDTWVETLADAARFADARTDVEAGKLGIVGFSLGGNLALRLAKLPAASPKALAVVDFFGPISQANGIGADVDKLPFVQIHHGDNDHVVPPSQSAGADDAPRRLRTRRKMWTTSFTAMLKRATGSKNPRTSSSQPTAQSRSFGSTWREFERRLSWLEIGSAKKGLDAPGHHLNRHGESTCWVSSHSRRSSSSPCFTSGSWCWRRPSGIRRWAGNSRT